MNHSPLVTNAYKARSPYLTVMPGQLPIKLNRKVFTPIFEHFRKQAWAAGCSETEITRYALWYLFIVCTEKNKNGDTRGDLIQRHFYDHHVTNEESLVTLKEQYRVFLAQREPGRTK